MLCTIERQTFTHKDSIVCSQKADYVVYRQSHGQRYVQTERQTIYVLCRQSDRQCCLQIDGHVQTTLCTDRKTDTALHIDEVMDGCMDVVRVHRQKGGHYEQFTGGRTYIRQY